MHLAKSQQFLIFWFGFLVKVYVSSFYIIFQLLEESIFTFVKDELKRMQRLLKSKCSDGEMDTDMNEGMRSSREAFQNIALHFLRRINHENLADSLQSSKNILQLHFNG